MRKRKKEAEAEVDVNSLRRGKVRETTRNFPRTETRALTTSAPWIEKKVFKVRTDNYCSRFVTYILAIRSKESRL